MNAPLQTPAQPPPPGDGADGGWDLENDALAHALAWLTQHHGQPRTPESLLSGLPVRGRIAPDQALRALHEAGYSAGLVQRGIGELHHLLLPAVLLLKEGDACIVQSRESDGRYRIVMPGREHHACLASEGELAAEYTGIALVATPVPQGQASQPAAHESAELLRDPATHWLWGTLRRFVPYYRAALLAALLSNVLMLATGLFTSVIYDKVIPHQAYVTLWALAAGAGIALLFDLAARQLRAYLIDMAGRKADLIVGSLLFRQTLAIRMERRPESAGAYAHHLAQIELVRDFFASATLSALSDLPFIVVFVAMAFVVGGPLGWVLVISIPLLLLGAALIQGRMRRATMSHMRQTADLHGVLVEAVDGIEDLKAAGAQGRFLRHYEQTTAAYANSMLLTRKLSAWTLNLSTVAQQAVTLVMLVWGVYLIDEKVITAGALIGAVMFANRALAPLASVVQLATRYQSARAAMRALDHVMEQPVERESGRVYVPRAELSGRLALVDAGFAYPAPGGRGEAGPPVLKGVTLRFEPGRVGGGPRWHA
jgi:ATP-binding cassette, subfamily C, bacterial LapB